MNIVNAAKLGVVLVAFSTGAALAQSADKNAQKADSSARPNALRDCHLQLKAGDANGNTPAPQRRKLMTACLQAKNAEALSKAKLVGR